MNTNNEARMRASAKIEESLVKLAFLSKAIHCWDMQNVPFDEDNQYGFALCMEDTIKEIQSCANVLEDCTQGVSHGN